MFRKIIQWYKNYSDNKTEKQAAYFICKFYSKDRQQKFLVDIILELDYNSDDLEAISNIFGTEAHMKNRPDYKKHVALANRIRYN
jgi:hypothetical protein